MTGEVLFTSRLTDQARKRHRVLGVVYAAVGLCLFVPLLIFLLVSVVLLMERSTLSTLTTVTLVLSLSAMAACTVMWLLLGITMWRAAQVSLHVTTHGVQVRNSWATSWFPWQEVDAIESSTSLFQRRATKIRLRSGTAKPAVVTAARNARLRGDAADPALQTAREPLLPTRMTREAHARYQRGEFGSS